MRVDWTSVADKYCISKDDYDSWMSPGKQSPTEALFDYLSPGHHEFTIMPIPHMNSILGNKEF